MAKAKQQTAWRNRVVGFIEKPANQFTANAYNFRRHPNNQRDAFRGVLSEIGFAGAVLENKTTGNLIDGHLRIEEALSSDENQLIPCVQVELSEAEEKLLLATYDPISQMAVADKETLDLLLHDVSAGDAAVKKMLSELAEANGLYFGEEQKQEAPEAEIDRAAELQEKWQVRRGDLYAIGRHRLLCGDSTSREDVERLMGGKRADICFTSPPYGKQRDYEKKIEDWDALMRGVFANVPLEADGQILVNLGLIHDKGEWQPYWDGWITWMQAQGWRRFGWYVWDQGPGMPGDWDGRLAPSFEFIFHFNRSSVKPEKARECAHAGERHGGKGQRSADGTVKPRSHGHAPVQSKAILDSVIRVNRQGAQHGASGHPAPYPPDLPASVMRSWPGLYLEPFAGSGATLVAGEQTQNSVRGLEIEPKYCAVILERMSAMDLIPKKITD